MTDEDLIDMLRTKRICTGFKPDGHGDVDIVYGPDPVTTEAADRIEQLSAERDGLIQTSALLCDDCGWSMEFPDCGCVYCGVHRIEAERESLRVALAFYADFYEDPNDGPWGMNSQDFGKVARAALKGEVQ